MNLHLLVPALFWPDSALPEIYRDLSLPGLENLLAKSSCMKEESQGIEAWLCRAFGIEKQQDWPIAPITLVTDGAGAIKTGDDYWVRADPVHLRIEHDQIVLADSRIFRISNEEAEQFSSLLNRHFCENGQEIKFLPLKPDRWYLRLVKTPPANTRLLSEAANKGIDKLLPFGANADPWRALFNEIQMVLHEHPLNEAREARGELAINSVWFWGGGIMPKSLASPFIHVWTNEVLASSLAAACGTEQTLLPADADAWQAAAQPGNHLITLGVLLGKAQYGDAYGWRESIKEVERRWFDPLWRMLKQGRLSQLRLIALDESSVKNFTIMHGDSRKFWRRQKPLSTYSP